MVMFCRLCLHVFKRPNYHVFLTINHQRNLTDMNALKALPSFFTKSTSFGGWFNWYFHHVQKIKFYMVFFKNKTVGLESR